MASLDLISVFSWFRLCTIPAVWRDGWHIMWITDVYGTV